MAHSLSAKKRMRQNAAARALNRARKGQIKTAVRAFQESVTGGDKAKAATTLQAAIKKLDVIAGKGAIHKNTAARKKSRLQRRFNALQAAKA